MSARYAAVILAGGFSSRMKQFKPLLPLGKKTIVSNVVDTFLNIYVDVILVTGHRHDEVATAINESNVNIVYNPNYALGMFSSIQAGIRHLQPDHQAFFVLPVDIPLVRPATIMHLIASSTKNQDKIIYPVFKGKRGHPPLIPSILASDILEWKKNGGLKAILVSLARFAVEVPVADSFILFDIDTPDDYLKLQERFKDYEIPTDEESDIILNDICKVAPERIRHGKKVTGVATAIGQAIKASGHQINMEAVRVAAVLHDIAKGQAKHDVAGGKILRELGFGTVADIVSVHSDLGGGNINLPLEAKIVYLADKFVKGERLVSIEERYDHPDWLPESRKFSLERREVAFRIKRELENLLNYPLEEIISRF